MAAKGIGGFDEALLFQDVELAPDLLERYVGSFVESMSMGSTLQDGADLPPIEHCLTSYHSDQPSHRSRTA